MSTRPFLIAISSFTPLMASRLMVELNALYVSHTQQVMTLRT